MVAPPPADQIGRVVGGRYRLTGLLGAGSSAFVYLAEDVTLGRSVAVKMLHPALSGDVRFLERFRAEAKTIASVSHPNIVTVFDSGVDEVPYVVTEYLAGGSLRGVIQAGHRLTHSQALLVGLEACQALAHAHGRDLVHRDMKPANLLFGEDARLHIADFGLARALAETGLTDHFGDLVGTVRYAAPEQALGQGIGPPGDVYALALVLIEAVTGQVPFAGQDAISMLQARTHGDLEVPEALGPLAGPLSRAGRLDPGERPDARDLGLTLLAVAETLPTPSPLPLVGAVAEADTSTDTEPDERTSLVTREDGHADDPGDDPDDDLDDAGSAVDRAGGTSGTRSSRRRWPLVLGALVLVGATIAAVLLYLDVRTPTHEIPDLVGRPVEELQAIAADNGWVLDQKKTRQNGTEPGDVVSTEPAAGERLAEGEVLVVLVSEGNELTEVPDELALRPLEDVLDDLERAGLDYDITRVHDEDVPVDVVIGTNGPIDPELARGDVVPLLVSDGPAPRVVPSFVEGSTFDQVAAELADLGLVAVRDEVFDDDAPAGTVLALSPEPGTEVARDSEVTVTTSKGPDLVAVPDLRGLRLDEAEKKLNDAGLELGQVCCDSKGRVVTSDPVAGTEVKRGSSVSLFLRR